MHCLSYLKSGSRLASQPGGISEQKEKPGALNCLTQLASQTSPVIKTTPLFKSSSMKQYLESQWVLSKNLKKKTFYFHKLSVWLAHFDWFQPYPCGCSQSPSELPRQKSHNVPPCDSGPISFKGRLGSSWFKVNEQFWLINLVYNP